MNAFQEFSQTHRHHESWGRCGSVSTEGERQGGRLMKLLQRINRKLQREPVQREGGVQQDEAAMDPEHHGEVTAPRTAHVRPSGSLSA